MWGTDLAQASFHSVFGCLQLLFLSSNQGTKDAEEIEVALRSDIIVSGQLSQVHLALPCHTLMDFYTHLNL